MDKLIASSLRKITAHELARDDVRQAIMTAAAKQMDGWKSLSGTGHHGGVRVYRDTVEIARVQVVLDEAGACSLPNDPEQAMVLTPAVEAQ